MLIAWNLFKKLTFCHLGLLSFNLFWYPLVLFAWYFLFLLEIYSKDQFLPSRVLKFQSFLTPFVVICMVLSVFAWNFFMKISFFSIWVLFLDFVCCFLFFLGRFLMKVLIWSLIQICHAFFWIKVMCLLFQTMCFFLKSSFVVGNLINYVFFLYEFITLLHFV